MKNQSSAFSNYPTWCVNVWLENKRSAYFYWREQARRFAVQAEEWNCGEHGPWTVEEAARFQLAAELRRDFYEHNPFQRQSVYLSLLSASAREVNWFEIAGNIVAGLLSNNSSITTLHESTLPLFHPGRIVAKRDVLSVINPDDIAAALERHLHGDWGLLSTAEWQANEMALKTGGPLESVHELANRSCFALLTRSDRSRTDVLLESR